MLKLQTKGIIIFSLFFLFAILAMAKDASAATINAASCSLSDVTAAYNTASAGDIVSIPAGTCSWSGSLSVSKGVTIQGAGAATVINSIGAGIFNIPASASGNIRLTAMKFTGTSGGGTDVNAERGWSSLRIDHIIWITDSSRGAWIGYSTGWNDIYDGIVTASQKVLFDHITYTSTSGGSPFLLVYGRGARAWREDDGFGTDNFIFVEDSNFTWSTYSLSHYVLDTEYAGRVVFRHNTLNNGWLGTHDFGSTPNSRGNRAMEMYNNTFTSDTYSGSYALNFVRGGTGLAYDNTFSNFETMNNPMIYRVGSGAGYIGVTCQSSGSTKMCQDGAKHNPSTKRPDAGSGNFTGCTSNSDCLDYYGNAGLCMQIDGNGSGGYPCRDQFGRGKDNALTGVQADSPIYWWNNSVSGVSNTPFSVAWWGAYEAENRDYCNHSPATTCGSIADWNYTAYIYPHPLQGGSQSDTTPPAAPRNVKVN